MREYSIRHSSCNPMFTSMRYRLRHLLDIVIKLYIVSTRVYSRPISAYCLHHTEQLVHSDFTKRPHIHRCCSRYIARLPRFHH